MILARSASEGLGCPRLRVGLVCRSRYPLLNQAHFLGDDFVDVTRRGRVRPDATNRGTRGRHKDAAQTATLPRALCPST